MSITTTGPEKRTLLCADCDRAGVGVILGISTTDAGWHNCRKFLLRPALGDRSHSREGRNAAHVLQRAFRAPLMWSRGSERLRLAAKPATMQSLADASPSRTLRRQARSKTEAAEIIVTTVMETPFARLGARWSRQGRPAGFACEPRSRCAGTREWTGPGQGGEASVGGTTP